MRLREQMQLVVDASVLGEPRSGVGVYAHEVLERLPTDWLIERRGEPHGPAQARGLLRRIPGAYAVRLARMGLPPAGAVFWATNFIAPRWPGPTVLTVHDLIFETHPEWADRTRGAFLRRALPGAIKRAAAVVVSTQAAKEEIEQRFHAGGKTHVIAPGIRQLTSGEEPVVKDAFVVAGNLEPRKDPWTALKAHRLLSPEERRSHPLLFVGAALDERYAKELVDALDPPYSRWLGRLPDAALTALYQHAKAVIAPSMAEGFGFVPLEAYAAGAPVIARDLPITRETMGARASYFREDEGLVRAMQEQPKKRQSPPTYTWDDTAKHYETLFRQCAGKRFA